MIPARISCQRFPMVIITVRGSAPTDPATGWHDFLPRPPRRRQVPSEWSPGQRSA